MGGGRWGQGSLWMITAPWAAFTCAAAPSEETDIVITKQKAQSRARKFFNWNPPFSFLHNSSVNAMIYSSQHVAQGQYCGTMTH